MQKIMDEVKTPSVFSRIKNVTNSDYEEIRIYKKDGIDINLIYPKNREHMVKTFINNTKQDLIDVLSSVKNNNARIVINIDDSGKLPVYNTIPYGGESSSVTSDVALNRHKIAISFDDVSCLLHERMHVLDYDSSEKYKKSESFKYIKDKIIDTLADSVDYMIANNPSLTFDTRKYQLVYETSDNEIFARILNQQFCRTHKPNIYADQLKPFVVDIVMDTLYQYDSEFRDMVHRFVDEVDELINYETVIRTDILNTKYIDFDDYQDFVNAILTINENNQFKL